MSDLFRDEFCHRHQGDLDLSEYFDRYRDQPLMLIIAPIGETGPATYTCGVCGFVMNEVGECPRCELAEEARDVGQGGESSLQEARERLDKIDGDRRSSQG